MPREIENLAARYGERYPEIAQSLRRVSQKAIKLNVPEFPFPPALSSETQQLIEDMEHDGYVIYNSLPTNLSEIQSKGARFWTPNGTIPDVAFDETLFGFKKNPDGLFVPNSKNIPFQQQLKLAENEKRRFKEKFGDAAVLREGRVQEWLMLASDHFAETKEKLFADDYFGDTWTATLESDKQGAKRARLCHWGDSGFAVPFNDDSRMMYPDLGLALLVEIPRG